MTGMLFDRSFTATVSPNLKIGCISISREVVLLDFIWGLFPLGQGGLFAWVFHKDNLRKRSVFASFHYF
jgi:hypothetical protein